jgi:hypothetical protein
MESAIWTEEAPVEADRLEQVHEAAFFCLYWRGSPRPPKPAPIISVEGYEKPGCAAQHRAYSFTRSSRALSPCRGEPNPAN